MEGAIGAMRHILLALILIFPIAAAGFALWPSHRAKKNGKKRDRYRI